MDNDKSREQTEGGRGADPQSDAVGVTGPLPLPSDLLRRLRLAAKRLETYSLRVQTALAAGDRDGLAQALSDVAEAHEIARRLSDSLLAFLQYTPPPEP